MRGDSDRKYEKQNLSHPELQGSDQRDLGVQLLAPSTTRDCEPGPPTGSPRCLLCAQLSGGEGSPGAHVRSARGGATQGSGT